MLKKNTIHFMFRHIAVVFIMFFLPQAFAEFDPRFSPDPAGAENARNVVEKILISGYENILNTDKYTASELTNAPVSGKSNVRGRHLLSFAAFNHFPAMASWGLDHQADINLGDKDSSNLLRMALGNYNEEMVSFALEHGADPNIKMGDGNDTMVSALIKWKWPAVGFFLARDYNAKLTNKAERKQVATYLNSLPSDELDNDPALLENGGDYRVPVNKYFENADVLRDDIESAGIAQTINIRMVDVMDNALLASLRSKELSENDMKYFFSKGRSFENFLAFNGFIKTLIQRLKMMDEDEAVDTVNKIDMQGNDLLMAAIKSYNEKLVATILGISNARVNAMVADTPYTYSQGQRPLHIAIQWGVPFPVFEVLIRHGADPSLPNLSGTSARQLLKYYEGEWADQPGKFAQVKRLLSGNNRVLKVLCQPS